MDVWNSRLKAGIFILAATTLLAFAKPAVNLLLQPEGGSFGLSMDYGVPTRWYGLDSGGRPTGVRLPENSIGLDFLSFDTYVRCRGLGPDLYGTFCEGDPFNRPFAYPPLLTAAFFWIPFFSTHTAAAVWSLAVLALLFTSGTIWGIFPGRGLGRRPVSQVLVSAFFLTLFYPAVFAFERGNTEALILFALTLAAWAVARERWFWAGFLTAAAAIAKMYPLLTWAGCVLLAAAFLATPGKKKEGMRLLAGSALGFLIPFAAMLPQHLKYFSSILPTYSRLELTDANCSFCHSWTSSFESLGYGLAVLLGAVAVLHFALFAHRFVTNHDSTARNRCLVSFAFGIGVSVYVPQLSYDYSLIMLLPLFMVCMLWDAPGKMNVRGVGFALTLIGASMPRWLEGLVWAKGQFSIFLILQTLGMALVGLSLVAEMVQAFGDRGSRGSDFSK